MWGSHFWTVCSTVVVIVVVSPENRPVVAARWDNGACLRICVFKRVKMCVWCIWEFMFLICMYYSVCVMHGHVMVCVFVAKARQVFLVFRAVLMRPQQGRGVGGRRGRHARLLDSLASRHGHSLPHFQWWTNGPCSAWLQKKTASVDRRGAGGRGEIEK